MAEKIYVPLLNEGVPDVWAPALGERVGPMTFRVIAPEDYDPAAEDWEFVPDTVVVCEERVHAGRRILLAVHRVDPAP